MSTIKAPRGTADILPEESWKWQAVESIAREVAAKYHFAEIRTPIFEHSELFHRGVGETTDVVQKETFTFTDRGGDSITLRPEGTAGVVRAMIENGLLAQEGSRKKVFYIGPNFRYERPQKGRLRQHHQFGVEAFGVGEPEQDAECILLQMDFYRRCGLTPDKLSLRVNTLGDTESKARYRDRVKAHFSTKIDQLSDESKQRLEINPLRILDSKDPRDVKAREGLPDDLDWISVDSKMAFAVVLPRLQEAGINYKVDNTLVRGFDYYTGILWEVTTVGLGSQDAIGGGGRYDSLIANLGGRPCPGVGFGSGLERLLMALEAQRVALKDSRPPLVWLVAHGDAARRECWKLMAELRAVNIAADMDLSGRSVKAQFTMANRESAKICLTIGETELAAGTVTVKDFVSGSQSTIPRGELVAHMQTISAANLTNQVDALPPG